MRAKTITAIQKVEKLPEVETDGSEQGFAAVSSATFHQLRPSRPLFSLARRKVRFQPRQLMAVVDLFQHRTKQIFHPAVLLPRLRLDPSPLK